MKSVVISLVLLIIPCCVECSKILVVFPFPTRSHYHLGNALAKGLAEAGHDVTMVSPYEEDNPPKNGSYRSVVLTGFQELIRENNRKITFIDRQNINPLLMPFLMNSLGLKVTQRTFEHPSFQNLLKSNEKFDLVILVQLTDGLKVLAHHYKAPIIIFNTMGANGWVNNFVGNPSPPSYVPDIFLSYTSDMNFKQRLVNWLFYVASEFNKHFLYFPKQNEIIKKHFPDAPDVNELNYNPSLILLNSHESINQAVPQVPNMVPIGGFHVTPAKELPKDLKDFMDTAKEGVVYFSMGSIIKPSQMTSSKREVIFRALGKFKQKVLWKWDEDTLPGKPDNVKLAKWFPQQDILAHPNTKLFITHGGLLSITETVYYGVPVLAFPIFADQEMNAAKAEADGYGISLSFSDITDQKLTEALDQLLYNPKYRENAKRRSRLMHDRPIKPMDLAVYWAEYVIRHGGAPHLRVAGVDLPWYIYLSLDVITFLIFISVGSLYAIYFIIKKLCCARKKNHDKLKKN